MDIDIKSAQPLQDIPVPTKVLRDKIRQFAQEHRDKLRAKSNDALRVGLGEIQAKVEELHNITEKDVHGLMKRIKRRKHASVDEMYRLSHAFLQSVDNIKVFAKEPGALQVIIKELTGTDSDRQIGAVECLCNLSLGEAPVCEKIVNLAGSYLVTYLDSLDERLKRTSLWTIANVIATSLKASQTIVQMEIVQKLWNLYTDNIGDKDSTNDFREDAAICLQLLVVHNKNVLRVEDLDVIRKGMCEKNRTSRAGEYHLQFLFHSEAINPRMDLSTEALNYVVNYSLANLCETDDFIHISNRLRILYGVRILANILVCQPHSIEVLMQQCKQVWNTNFENILNKIFEFKERNLTIEVIYLLRQLIPMQESENASVYRLENLRLPIMDYMTD